MRKYTEAEQALLADLDEQLENVSAIATAAGLPADASAEEVVARVGEMRAIRDAAIADYHAENAKAAARRSLDATVEEVRDAGAEHIRCHQTLRRLAEEAGRA